MSNNSFLRQTATTIVFIDASLSDYHTLQTGIIEGVKTVIISPEQDGIEQISQILQQHPHITTIHILSHGAPGCLYLGNSQLNLTNIHNYTQQLQQWQPQNILLYGCNVAAGDAGTEFIHKLHQITTATISASTTKTGNAALGGNWQLEVNIPVTDEINPVKNLSPTRREALNIPPSLLGKGVRGLGSVFNAHTLHSYQGVFAPTLVGNYNTSGSAWGVQVVGNYAYVGDGYSGLQIIDISNPTTPTLKGNYNTSGNAYGVQVVGNYAYVADEYSGLQIIDISNPTTPTLKGNYDTSGRAIGVQVVGNYAYVADEYSGLQIIDISNPTTPTLKGNYDTSGYASGVQVVGNYAYVADGYSGLQIIDISNSTTPTLKGNYDTSGWAEGVLQVVGNYAYVGDSGSGLQIIDISNPTTPTLKGNYDTSGNAYGVQVVGNYAYITDWGSGLQIIDISNPTTPTLKGNYDTSGNAYGVQVVGNYAYVADGNSGLQIIDVSEFNNQAPTNLTLSNSTIAENQIIGTVVGNLTTTDPDTANTFTYSLVTGDGATDNSLFTITNNQLTTNFVFDFETKNSYSVRLRTTDQGGLFFERQLTIGVTDLNETPTNLTPSNSTVAENQIIGTVIGNLSTTDPDTANTFTYSLVTGDGATDNSLFTITNNQLTTNAVFDFETKNSYSVRLRTTDQGGLFFERQLTIGVTDLNETPTNLTPSNSTVAENQIIGTVIGNLSTTDPDTANTFTYSLVTGDGATDNSLFTITNNQLTTNFVFDFETKNSYSVRLRTTDQGGLFFERQLTIGVTDLNETPTNLTLSNSTVAENQIIGTVVGNLTTTDTDTGNTFTYSLVTGNGATDNSLFTISGNQLRTNFVFDFETKNSYSIRVRTTDQGELFFEKQLTIGVTDLNDNESFTSTAQQDIIDADYGDDTITSTFANLQQNDTIKGGNGTDTLIITGGTVNDLISIDTSNTTNQLDIPGTTVFGFERFDLTSFAGTISFNGTTGNDWIKAGTGNDDLGGGNGNDTLNGGAGADLLGGGSGNDTYVVDNVGDVIIEFLNSGIDNVESSITWTLRNHLENLTLQGTTAINGTGNNLNNIITGNTGNNVLTGGLGNDSLIGGLGNDTLIGGAGNDSYYVDNTADIITENANEGTDSVFTTVTYTLTTNTENLTLQGTIAINGTGNTLSNIITGNAADNVLTGGAGADTLIGGAGNDSYYVDNTADTITENANEGTDSVFTTVTYTLTTNTENLKLQGTTAINGTGNDLNNIITGNTGNNVLTGGTGADTLIGGAGNDSYYVDSTADTITELVNQGTDIVFTTVTYTLTPNTENLTLQGTTAINGTGNDLNNIITGNTGNNVLTGGLGNDTLIGGAGNDSYYVDNTADTITELVNQGTDIVFTTVTYTLTPNTENLTLQGTTAINGTGNDLNNIITGNAAANILTGGFGNDSLYLGLNDNAVDNVNYVLGDATDTVYHFVRGVGGDRLNFTGIANFDVITSGNTTLVRAGDGIGGNIGFGTGQLLVTLSGTLGFNSTNAKLNLFGGTFLFS
ncbi:DUF4347 domain-containing protein [Dolichospermum sp. FACHB-1091]|uniref:DUF4347 domain-containing protein n=1 Tax=Dolichospermum sp. FACHB-1091 TaxID=2692798 RepID=UPI001680BDCF|nr:DUF4347 domain-containing protein [Dolichospermum sp. FACHB-1091]MBD2443154.1 DUF4347 domain-containing protein [Dolichospermum sp. FACHB-1091]